jgi:starch synthase (maltosyl-transferring)
VVEDAVALRSETSGRSRAVIENVSPEIDAGRFPIKRTLGERVTVEADVFADGRDQLAVLLCHRQATQARWIEVPMEPLGNDRWRAEFVVEALGAYCYTVIAWVDRFSTWRHDLVRREDANDAQRALGIGAVLIEEAAGNAPAAERKTLLEAAGRLVGEDPLEQRLAFALSDALPDLMARYAERRCVSTYARELEVTVDREMARFSAWYELFPRSTYDGASRHGTLQQVEQHLPYIADMGFDVVYLPPIHPIGETHRKGPNNALDASPEDPGCPWAIGSKAGEHTSIHPELGTMDDFRSLRETAAGLGLEVALDLAFQCSPDHPYVHLHPEWFRRLPDGSIQYAENPPKKYEDIYPFDFESEDWEALWQELKGVVEFWIEQGGLRIFRVDNPHTKPFAFWEWLIGDIKTRYPETIFLAEAFTRPKVMHRLAKLGFTQSYTYFTWRNTKREIIEYVTELTTSKSREYFRPNLWPNTPDILHEYLQFGGRPAFMSRLVLAATLGANYGIYGPAFELLEATPRAPGSEEYLDSEKYQIRNWDLSQSGHLGDFVARVNRIRRENAALHYDWNLRFHAIDNEQVIGYSKVTDDMKNIIFVVVSLDPNYVQSGFVEVPIEAWGIEQDQAYQVHDLLSGARYLWHGSRNYIELDPQRAPAHIFRVRRRIKREQDFDYFM